MSSVLIVTNEQDLAADLVVLELVRRGDAVLRCNTEHLSRWLAACEPGISWRLEDHLGRVARSDQVRGVWWRRPEPPSSPLAFAGAEEQSAFVAQWQALLESFASVPGPRWISPPSAIRIAEDKALQLAVAARIGFRVPKTVWTNDVSAVGDHSNIVAKPVTTAAWEDDDGPAFVFAQLIGREDMPAAGELAVMPVAFQVPIWPKRDVRVTVVGECVLAAAIDDVHPSPSVLDWRLDLGRRWVPYVLDREDRERCRTLVADLGLGFGGIDLAIDDEGTTWFLEINPNGEWGWLAKQARLPIVEALCDELTCKPHDAV